MYKAPFPPKVPGALDLEELISGTKLGTLKSLLYSPVRISTASEEPGRSCKSDP